MMTKTREAGMTAAMVAMLVALMVALWGCTPAPASAPGPDLAATVAALEAQLAAMTPEIVIVTAEPVVVVATPDLTPEPLLPTPTATPEYRVVACGVRPPNGTLIEIIKPTTSRSCADSRCKNQGTVVAGSVRPLEAMDWNEATGDAVLRFTYLPLEGIKYNLLYEEWDGNQFVWKIEDQWVTGGEGDEFQCVEPWQ